MSLYALVEPVIVGGAVAASLIVIIRKQAPGLWHRLTGSTKPASSCGGCSGCSDSKPTEKPKRVNFYRKRSGRF